MNTYMALIQRRATAEQREEIAAALAPPNRVDPDTDLPYGWDEDTELDGFRQALRSAR